MSGQYKNVSSPPSFEDLHYLSYSNSSSNKVSIDMESIGSSEFVVFDDTGFTSVRKLDPYGLVVLDAAGDHILIANSGTYEITFSGAPATTDECYNQIKVNGSNYASAYREGADTVAISCSCIVELVSGDEVQFANKMAVGGTDITEMFNVSFTLRQLK